jgi:hypothetical protein
MLRVAPHDSLRLLPLVLLTALGVACGVTFGAPEEGTEVFKGLEVRGERVGGAPLTVSVEVTQCYPLPVRIGCYYEDDARLTDDEKKLAFAERATLIGETVLPAATTGRPDEATAVQTISFDFQIDEAGDYVVACLTPAAPENGWSVRLQIEDAATATEGR